MVRSEEGRSSPVFVGTGRRLRQVDEAGQDPEHNCRSKPKIGPEADAQLREASAAMPSGYDDWETRGDPFLGQPYLRNVATLAIPLACPKGAIAPMRLAPALDFTSGRAVHDHGLELTKTWPRRADGDETILNILSRALRFRCNIGAFLGTAAVVEYECRTNKRISSVSARFWLRRHCVIISSVIS